MKVIIGLCEGRQVQQIYVTPNVGLMSGNVFELRVSA